MMIVVAEKCFAYCLIQPVQLHLYVNFLAYRNRHWKTKLIQRNPPLFVFIPYLYQSHKYFIFNYVLSLYIVAELVIFLTGRPPMQFSSVAQSCLTLCNPMDFSTPGFPAYHQLPEPTQTHVHRVSDAIQPSHPLSQPSYLHKIKV